MGRFIDKVGIEVECGTDGNLIPENVPNFRKTRDGSLRAAHRERRFREHAKRLPEQGRDVALQEWISEPHEWTDEKDRLRSGLDQIYSHIIDINPTMGLHIHVSLNKEIYYQRLQSQKYQDYYIDRIKDSDLYERDDALKRRINDEGLGRSNYCEKHADADNMHQNIHGSGRYYHLNFSNRNRSSRNTIEYRTMPAMDSPSDVLDAITLIATTINGWLMKGDWNDKATTQAKAKSKPDKKVIEMDMYNNIEERRIPQR